MKHLKIIFFVCTVVCFKWAFSQRRVLNGQKVTVDKPYMVYLMKHHWSHALYEGWICGGTIIHPIYVLTSATCVKDVYNIFVVSGTREYTPKALSEDNLCTRKTKRKVISLCEFATGDYNITNYYTYNSSSDTGRPNAANWAQNMLGLARIEKPFAFHSDDYNHCDYKPQIISVNFLKRYERPGTQAILLGWGNRRFYRPVRDRKIYNERFLQYASTVIVNKTYCLDTYEKTNMKYQKSDMGLLCSDGQGILNDMGLPIDFDDVCFDCEETTKWHVNRSRRWYKGSTYGPKTTTNWMSVFGNGPCQNDHGGPLVTWIGGRETVIGVIAAFRVTTQMECKGPFIFASTACAGKLIFCITSTRARRSADYCNEVALRSGFRIYQTFFNWNETKLEKGPKRTMNGPATLSGLYGNNDQDFANPGPLVNFRAEIDNSSTTTSEQQEQSRTRGMVTRNTTTISPEEQLTDSTIAIENTITSESNIETRPDLMTSEMNINTTKERPIGRMGQPQYDEGDMPIYEDYKSLQTEKEPNPNDTFANNDEPENRGNDNDMYPWTEHSETLGNAEYNETDPSQMNNTKTEDMNYSDFKILNNTEDVDPEFYEQVDGNVRRHMFNSPQTSLKRTAKQNT